MRIRQLKIKDFRNLLNFEINFNDESITAILGRNGAAKTNLIEFIAHVFTELELEKEPEHAYYLSYECRTREIEIDANYSDSTQIQVKVGKRVSDQEIEYEVIDYRQFVNKKGRRYQDYLPTNIIVYYSGLSTRLKEVCEVVKESYVKNLERGDMRLLRRLFLTDGSHSPIILFSFLADNSQWAKDFLLNRMGIVDMESVIIQLIPDQQTTIPSNSNLGEVLKKIAQHSIPLREFDYGVMDPSSSSAKGMAFQKKCFFYFDKNFPLTSLLYRENIRDKKSTNIIESDKTEFKQVFSRPKDLFQRLEDISLFDVKLDFHFKLKLAHSKKPIPLDNLSEGEQQLLTVIGLLRFTKDNDTLFLLDEPDTHLNPQWSYEYKKMLEEVMKNEDGSINDSSQIIMTTHDPIMISGLRKESVRIMKRESVSNENNDPEETRDIVKATPPTQDLIGMSVARILEGEIFGVPSFDEETIKKLQRKRELAFENNKELSIEELEELRRLIRELRYVDMTQIIEDPLYSYFVASIVNHPDYILLKQQSWTYETYDRLKHITEDVKREMLAKVEKELEEDEIYSS